MAKADRCVRFFTFRNFLCYNIYIKLDAVQNRILSYAARVRRHRKDLYNIKIAPKERFTHTPTQLKNLIEAAQRGKRTAIERLCHDFAPLIYKEARRTSVQSALGEDAVNTAWVIFLEFIQKYKGSNYRLLPGLVQKHVHYGLSDKIRRKKSVTSSLSLDTSAETTVMEIADKNNAITQYEEAEALSSALSKLTLKQRDVISAVLQDGVSITAYSRLNRISYKSAYLHLQRGLTNLKRTLNY